MPADLEALFPGLKGGLGLRPIFHSQEERSDGHLFISVLAYQFVQAIRQRLKVLGIHTSWAGLREVLSVQRRVTASFTQKDGRTLHVRKSTRPEPVRLYEAGRFSAGGFCRVHSMHHGARSAPYGEGFLPMNNRLLTVQ
jgi:hypothetical protein